MIYYTRPPRTGSASLPSLSSLALSSRPLSLLTLSLPLPGPRAPLSPHSLFPRSLSLTLPSLSPSPAQDRERLRVKNKLPFLPEDVLHTESFRWLARPQVRFCPAWTPCRPHIQARQPPHTKTPRCMPSGALLARLDALQAAYPDTSTPPTHLSRPKRTLPRRDEEEDEEEDEEAAEASNGPLRGADRAVQVRPTWPLSRPLPGALSRALPIWRTI